MRTVSIIGCVDVIVQTGDRDCRQLQRWDDGRVFLVQVLLGPVHAGAADR